LADLAAIDAYGGFDDHAQGSIRVCSRTGDPIEPMMRKQWFLHCDAMNDAVLRVIDQGKVRQIPHSTSS
jgi:valyl-tRNA synthetase